MVLIKYTPLPSQSDSRPRIASGYSDAPVSPEEVKQMVARSVEGLLMDNVYVTFTRASGIVQTPAPAIAGSVTTAAKSDSDGSTSSAADKSLLMRLFAATALFGLIIIVLTAMLVREKRRQRLMGS
jgi:type III secretory pathway lipoprotein EscJ